MNIKVNEKFDEEINIMLSGMSATKRVTEIVKNTFELKNKMRVERDIAKTAVDFISNVFELLDFAVSGQLGEPDEPALFQFYDPETLIANLQDEKQLAETVANAIEVLRTYEYQAAYREKLLLTIGNIQRVMAAPTYKLVQDYINRLLSDSEELREVLLDQLNGNVDPYLKFNTPTFLKN